MPSLKSKLVIFTLRNRHLLKFRLKPEVITRQTDTVALRKSFEEGARKFGAIPAGVEISPVTIPSLPAGLAAEWIHLEGSPAAPAAPAPAIFYTHGGGYISGSCADHRNHVARFVKAAGIGALLYEYRLAPEHPFPAAVEDTLAAYRWLLAQGVAPDRTVIAGESAGGGLCLAGLLAIRDEGLPLPAGAAALSPWLDLHCTSPSYRTNARRDISTAGSWDVWGDYYCAQADRSHPWLSPVYGDLRGLPPILIEVGDCEIMLDDSVRFAEKAKAAGVEMDLRVWEGMVHCFPLLAPMFPEATQAWNEVIAFIQKRVAEAQAQPVLY